MYAWIKSIHIIFIVTWFSGMFYIVRLFVYQREAQDLPIPERDILTKQYRIMTQRLWLGITWPSAILTLVMGLWMWHLLGATPGWLLTKLGFVLALFLYHASLQYIYSRHRRGLFPYSSMQLRIWNEVATVLLVAIVSLVVVKENMSVVWGLAGLFGFVLLLLAGIRIYKLLRSGSK